MSNIGASLSAADDEDSFVFTKLLPRSEVGGMHDCWYFLQSWDDGEVGIDVKSRANSDCIALPALGTSRVINAIRDYMAAVLFR